VRRQIFATSVLTVEDRCCQGVICESRLRVFSLQSDRYIEPGMTDLECAFENHLDKVHVTFARIMYERFATLVVTIRGAMLTRIYSFITLQCRQ
jgi:hypothetical protein